jgi:hypothetical protein
MGNYQFYKTFYNKNKSIDGSIKHYMNLQECKKKMMVIKLNIFVF